MRRIFLGFFLVCAAAGGIVFAQNADKPKARLLVMISEQNIEGPAREWWRGDIGISAIEADLSRLLIEQGYQVVEPTVARKIMRKEKVSRAGTRSDEAVIAGRFSRADFVVTGKAFSSVGMSTTVGSSAHPCFASVSVQLIRTTDGVVAGSLDAFGSSVNADTLVGGKDALSNAAVDLASKIVSYLAKESGS